MSMSVQLNTSLICVNINNFNGPAKFNQIPHILLQHTRFTSRIKLDKIVISYRYFIYYMYTLLSKLRKQLVW